MSDFERELKSLINRHSQENGSNTPDFILARYLNGCLRLFDSAVESRAEWYGRRDFPGCNSAVTSDLQVAKNPQLIRKEGEQ